jgi:hypothetical protein
MRQRLERSSDISLFNNQLILVDNEVTVHDHCSFTTKFDTLESLASREIAVTVDLGEGHGTNKFCIYAQPSWCYKCSGFPSSATILILIAIPY